MERSACVAGNLVGDRRGAVSTEYIVLLGVVGIVVAVALVAIGPGLVADYLDTRSLVAAPFP